MSAFPTLLSPLKVGGLTLRNRTIMGSMHTGLEEAKDDPFGRMSAYFGERAKGGAGLIVTGGVAPNWEGRVYPGAARLTKSTDAVKYRPVTAAVHEHGGSILMQILHAGRYAYSPIAVAPSAVASPLWRFSPMLPIAMPKFWVRKTISDFAHCAKLAREAGFDGVEIMGSEGYLLNEFLVNHTNKRRDEYGGSYENRMRFPLAVIRAVREAVPEKDFIIMFRLSLIDLIPNGSTRAETHTLAEEAVKAGADILNTGIGWHEARIPTIATSVPRAAYTWVTRACRDHLRSKGLSTPMVATNRINTPQVAEDVLHRGDSDLVSMARPFLADASFVNKARDGKASEINICIGCNQACLDHTFKMKVTSCLVNPVACHETSRTVTPSATPGHVVVVGAGPAGCHAAITLADRGHRVTLLDKNPNVGGQFHLAKRIPGKDEFESAIAYWSASLKRRSGQISTRLGVEATPALVADIAKQSTQPLLAVVLACGATSKPITNADIEGAATCPHAVSYLDVLTGKSAVGQRVAIIGGGGIGFDVALFVTHAAAAGTIQSYAESWGVDLTGQVPGGLTKASVAGLGQRAVSMFQRRAGKMGANLGPTTGWIHRLELKKYGVRQVTGARYEALDADGTLRWREADGASHAASFDTIIFCHGQSIVLGSLQTGIAASLPGVSVLRIGGCREALELDAKRAILEAHEMAMQL